MGIALLFVSVLLFAYCMIFMPSDAIKRIWITGSILLLALDSAVLILNDTEHFGMKRVSSSHEQSLVSSGRRSQRPKLVYRSLGNGKEKIYYYRTHLHSKKLSATDPMNTTVAIKRDKGNKLTVIKYYWEYHNEAAKIFFAGGQPNHQFIDQHFIFHLQKDWQITKR